MRLRRLLLSIVELHPFIILNERGVKGKRSQNWDLSLNSVPCLLSFSTVAEVEELVCVWGGGGARILPSSGC